MFRRRCTVVRRSSRLSLETLEARWNPASVTYTPATQTLTVITDTDDTINVSQVASRPAGFLTITDGSSTVFNAGRFVKHLRIDARNDQFSNVTVASGTNLAGSLSVVGGPLGASFTVGQMCFIAGGVTYTGTGTAADTVDIQQLTSIAGAVTLNLGEGGGFTTLRGLGYGSLKVTGGSGSETVQLAAGAGLSVSGSVVLQLGNGNNSVTTGNLCQIAGGLSVVTGNGFDSFQIASGQQLYVGGNVGLTLGPARGSDGGNNVILRSLKVAGSVAYNGGNGSDFLTVEDDVFIGKNLAAKLLNGANTADIDSSAVGARIQGGFSWVGGSGEDRLEVADLLVGGNIAVSLGDNLAPVSGQKCEINGVVLVLGGVTITGGKQNDAIELDEDVIITRSLSINSGPSGTDSVTIDGTLVSGLVSILTGAGNDTVLILDSYFLGTLTLATGAGADTITMDENRVLGAAVFNVGTGSDAIQIESQARTGDSTFGSAVSFIGGTGMDSLTLSTGTGLIRFGGAVKLNGGAEADPFNTSDTVFEVPFTGSW